MAGIAAPIIGMAGSLLGGIFGSSASKAAGKTISNKGNDVGQSLDKATAGAIDAGYQGIGQANNAIGTGLGNANGVLQGVYGTEMGNLNPYLSAGQSGIGQLGQLAGNFSFNPSDLQNDPGYQFRLNQGNQAILRNASATGGTQNGGVLKALAGYNEDMAGQEYQNAYNRALSTYGTNIGSLGMLAGFGQNANSQAITAGNNFGNVTSGNEMGAGANLANIAMQGNQYVGNTGLYGAQAAGNMYMEGAQGYAAGQMGAGNAWNSALGGMANAGMGLGSIAQNGGGGLNNGYYSSSRGYVPVG